MTKDKRQPRAKSASFEDAMTQLSEIVRALEEGNLSLNDSLQKYEAGIGFLNQCQKKLTEAERKIELLSGFDAAGNPVTEPFDSEDMTLQQKADSRSRRRTARPSGVCAEQSTDQSHSAEKKDEQRDVDLGGTLF